MHTAVQLPLQVIVEAGEPKPKVRTGELEVLRENLGLNQPFFVRYTIWLTEALKVNMLDNEEPPNAMPRLAPPAPA